MEQEEDKFTKFLQIVQAKKKLLIGLFLGAALIISGLSMLRHSRNKSISEAFHLCQDLESKSLQEKDLTEKVEKAFQFKEIKDRFESVFAQKSLSRCELLQAKKWMKDPLKSLKKTAPEYAEFSKIAYFIASKDYQKSLKKSLELEKVIQKEEMPSLYLCNLYRIAYLYHKLNEETLEKKYLKKLQTEVQKEKLGQIPFDPWKDNPSLKAYLEQKL